jgi:hypothetical protein
VAPYIPSPALTSMPMGDVRLTSAPIDDVRVTAAAT